MRKRLLAAAAGLAGALAIALAPAAEAHGQFQDWNYGCGYAGWFGCGHGGVNYTHLKIFACDDYADGMGFLTQYVRGGQMYTVRDTNGAKDGCGWHTWTSGGATKFRTCSDRGSYDICLDWQET